MRVIRTNKERNELEKEFSKRYPHARDIHGYEGWYKITREGIVFSFCSHNIKKTAINIMSEGYKSVSLSKNCKSSPNLVHRLVATTYIPNPKNLPCVNHIDGNKLNNNVANLEWVTYRDNNKHAFNTNLSKIKLSLEEAESVRKLYRNTLIETRELANQYNVTLKVILDILHDKIWTPTKYPHSFNLGTMRRTIDCIQTSKKIKDDFYKRDTTYKNIAKRHGIVIGSLQHILNGGILSHKACSKAKKRKQGVLE